MTHYICTGGCEGVSDKPGTCKAEDCEKRGQPLTECDCNETAHGQGDEENNDEK